MQKIINFTPPTAFHLSLPLSMCCNNKLPPTYHRHHHHRAHNNPPN